MAKKKAKKNTKDNPNKVSLKEELFCYYYTHNEELFGNATHCYAESYGYKLDDLPKDDAVYEQDPNNPMLPGKKVQDSSYQKAYNVCSVEGNRLLRKPKISKKIRELLNKLLKDEIVDSELAKVIMQNKELASKVAGIREYNKLKQRIIDKVDHTTKGKKIKSIIIVKHGGTKDQPAA